MGPDGEPKARHVPAVNRGRGEIAVGVGLFGRVLHDPVWSAGADRRPNATVWELRGDEELIAAVAKANTHGPLALAGARGRSQVRQSRHKHPVEHEADREYSVDFRLLFWSNRPQRLLPLSCLRQRGLNLENATSPPTLDVQGVLDQIVLQSRRSSNTCFIGSTAASISAWSIC